MGTLGSYKDPNIQYSDRLLTGFVGLSGELNGVNQDIEYKTIEWIAEMLIAIKIK
jgi:hypothetical protein